MYTIITRHPNSNRVQAIQVGAAAFETSSDTFRSEERERERVLPSSEQMSLLAIYHVRRKPEGVVVISKRERT